MKKLTSISGKISLVTVILFSAITAIAKPTTKTAAAVNAPYEASANIGNAESNAPEWSLVFNNDQQKLFVKQATNSALPASISITNTEGITVYNGSLPGNGNINISNLQTGKYTVRLQNNSTQEVYKLLVL